MLHDLLPPLCHIRQLLIRLMPLLMPMLLLHAIIYYAFSPYAIATLRAAIFL